MSFVVPEKKLTGFFSGTTCFSRSPGLREHAATGLDTPWYSCLHDASREKFPGENPRFLSPRCDRGIFKILKITFTIVLAEIC